VTSPIFMWENQPARTPRGGTLPVIDLLFEVLSTTTLPATVALSVTVTLPSRNSMLLVSNTISAFGIFSPLRCRYFIKIEMI